MTPATVQASIITIGDELLIGQTIDTNSAFIAQELNRIGIWVRKRVAVGDVAADIRQALDDEGPASDIILITGGLGPTADDITKPLLCNYFGGKLVRNEAVLEHIKYLFEQVFRRPGPLLDRNVRQADVPDVCEVLTNEWGTAPGMMFRKRRADGKEVLYFSLPGVPHEMKGLMKEAVLPRLLKELTLPAILHRTAFTAGLGESVLAEMLKDYEPTLPPHIKLAYLPSYGMVKLRLTARGTSASELERELLPLFDTLKALVKDHLVAGEDVGLETVVGRLLQEQGKTLGTAESCTGGYIAHLLTSIPGSSRHFMGSLIAYDNRVKQEILEVPSTILQTHGAVSEETVRAMAAGARRVLATDYIIAVSGIMGPDGGTSDKPVGTVWVAVGDADRIETRELRFRFDRQRNITLTALHALNLLRRFILTRS
jgi:nicotinamide-nucleotide amidase